jgi:hypothetical protein
MGSITASLHHLSDVNTKVSSIRPKIKVIKDRNGNNKREVEVKEQLDNPEEIEFYYSTASYDS